MNQDNETRDTGEPIAPLAELEQEVSPHFLGAIRKKIYRRTAANQMVSLAWNLPRAILMEMIVLISHVLATSSTKGRA